MPGTEIRDPVNWTKRKVVTEGEKHVNFHAFTSQFLL